MTQEKMMKIAKGLDVAVKIITVVAAIAMVFSVTLTLVNVFGNLDEMLGNEVFITSTVEFGNAEFTFNNSDLSAAETVKKTAVVACVFSVVGFLAFFYGAKLIRKTLASMKIGKPFEPVCSESIKKLAIFVLVYGFVFQIAGFIYSNYMLKAYTANIGGENYGMNLVGVSFNFDLTFIIISGVLFLLCYVFKYGEILQKDSDETL